MIRRPTDHDPERDVAAYVSGELSAKDLRRFEAHLMECEVCWREVQLSREGRRLADSGRRPAPARLREDVRAAVTLSAGGPRRRRRLLVAAFTVSAVVVAGTIAVLSAVPSTAQPPEIEAALASYRSREIPPAPPERVAPDLGAAGLELMGGGARLLGPMPTDVFAYREPSGARVFLFISSSAFPEASGATRRGSGMAPGWTARAGGLSLLCGSRPTSFLLVGADAGLLQQAEWVLAGLSR